jgi:hypothetical protein
LFILYIAEPYTIPSSKPSKELAQKIIKEIESSRMRTAHATSLKIHELMNSKVSLEL